MRLRPCRKLSSMMQPARGDDAAAPADQIDCRMHGAAGRQQIVEHDDALAVGDRILLNLDRVAAVFEVIGEAHGRARQFSLLADHRKAAAELVGDGCGDEKAARFDPDQQVGPVRPQRLGQARHRHPPCLRVREQGRDVVKEDPGFWKIGYRSDVLLEVHEACPRRRSILGELPRCGIAAFAIVGKSLARRT